eukprot:1158322-Pelagomonas_calceolata.AAC.4
MTADRCMEMLNGTMATKSAKNLRRTHGPNNNMQASRMFTNPAKRPKEKGTWKPELVRLLAK